MTPPKPEAEKPKPKARQPKAANPLAANVAKLNNRVSKLEEELAAVKAALASNLNVSIE